MKLRLLAMASLSVLTALTAAAGALTETFATDPTQRGWQIFGNTNLYTWDSANQNLRVTWDSATSTNSYYYLPLGKTLTKNDAFTLSFDLQLNDIAAFNYGQQIAAGLVNFSEATNTAFSRPNTDSPDLAEFDYFPDTGFGNSLGSTLADFTVSSTSYSDFYFTYGKEALVPGVTYHIVLSHAAGSATVAGQVYTNGVLYSAETNVYTAPIADFRVDTLAIENYADDGYGDGNDILAHGTVDNIALTYSAPEASETVVMDSFFTDPQQTGWNTFGDTNLFTWDTTNLAMDVTWDSSQSNSYFYKPLGTTLTKADAFAVDFDVTLSDITWSNSFQIALGLLNLAEATDPGFSRPSGYSPDLFEYDYFPDDGTGKNPPEPNVAGSMTDHTAQITDFPDFYFIYDTKPMKAGTTYHVRLEHAAGTGMLSGVVSTNGVVYSTMSSAYPGSIGDFQLDTVAVCSYSGPAQDSSYFSSILAHGTVDNFEVTLPPPSRNLVCTNNESQWQVQFGTFANWQYTLERSTNMLDWSDASLPLSGTGQSLTLTDTNAAAARAFYRIRASQP